MAVRDLLASKSRDMGRSVGSRWTAPKVAYPRPLASAHSTQANLTCYKCPGFDRGVPLCQPAEPLFRLDRLDVLDKCGDLRTCTPLDHCGGLVRLDRFAVAIAPNWHLSWPVNRSGIDFDLSMLLPPCPTMSGAT